jgi:hypothetical protein
MDHDEIRQWAEERNARPSCVRGTGGGEDVGMIRLDFPGFSGEQSLEQIEWDDGSRSLTRAAWRCWCRTQPPMASRVTSIS